MYVLPVVLYLPGDPKKKICVPRVEGLGVATVRASLFLFMGNDDDNNALKLFLVEYKVCICMKMQ